MHILPGTYIKPLKPKIKSSKYLLVEIDNFKGSDIKLKKAGVFSDGTTLKDHLSSDSYKKVVSFFEKFGLSEDMICKFEPWYLGMLAEILQTGLLVDFSSLPMDVYVIRIAKIYKVKIISLETLDEQINYFDNLPFDVQEAMLLNSIEDNMQKEFKMMKKSYIEGDIDEIEKMLEKETYGKGEKMKEFFDVFIVKRNENMNKKAIKYLEKGGVFVAVGLGHIITENGMVNFLKKRGFKVKRCYVTFNNGEEK